MKKIVITLGLLALFGLLSGYLLRPSPSLQAWLFDDCELPCWQAIKLYITDATSLVDALEQAEINYSTTYILDNQLVGIHWRDGLLTTPPFAWEITVFVEPEVISEANSKKVVTAIHVNLTLCLSNLISVLGKPDYVLLGQSTGRYQLIYADSLWIFQLNDALEIDLFSQLLNSSEQLEGYLEAAYDQEFVDMDTFMNSIPSQCVDVFKSR